MMWFRITALKTIIDAATSRNAIAMATTSVISLLFSAKAAFKEGLAISKIS